jgi:hypothetical protein
MGDISLDTSPDTELRSFYYIAAKGLWIGVGMGYNKYDKRISAENSIKNYLGQIRDLEALFGVVRAEEIVNGRSKFLRSKAIGNQIRYKINSARAVERKHNKGLVDSSGKMDDFWFLDMVEPSIEKFPIFIQSRLILRKIKEHSEKIKNGLMVRMTSKPFEEAESRAAKAETELPTEELRKLAERAKTFEERLKAGAIENRDYSLETPVNLDDILSSLNKSLKKEEEEDEDTSAVIDSSDTRSNS